MLNAEYNVSSIVAWKSGRFGSTVAFNLETNRGVGSCYLPDHGGLSEWVVNVFLEINTE